MVYGFVKQSGGHACIRSEVGRGTAVTLYLPHGAAGSISGEVAAKRSPLPAEHPGRRPVCLASSLDLGREQIAAPADGLDQLGPLRVLLQLAAQPAICWSTVRS